MADTDGTQTDRESGGGRSGSQSGAVSPRIEGGGSLPRFASRRPFGRRRRALAFSHLLVMVVLLGWTSVAMGQKVYRWTDDKGKPQFGDRPPTKSAEEVQVHVPPVVADPLVAERLRKLQKQNETQEEERKEEAKKKGEKKTEQDQKAQACESARAHLAGITIGRLVQLGPSGERRYLDDAEQQQAIAVAQRKVDEQCKR